MISETDREELKKLVDIVEIVEETVKLKKEGGRYKACCPFHNEKTPSFIVDRVKGRYHCFGCGESGDAVQFIMKTKGWGYREAIQYLAQKYNYTIDEEPQTPEMQLRDLKRRTQLRLNRRATDFFKDQLRNNADAWAYVTGRWSEESIEHWDIGYAPADRYALWNHLLSLGEKIEDLEESTLFTCKRDEVYSCVFFDRITMPIFSLSNDVLAFSARELHHTPNSKCKYLNSRASALYAKNDTLYGWSFAVKRVTDANQAVLVEGNADVIKMHEVGITNTVAVSGTSFTENHAKRIAAKAKTAVMIFDGDNAGINATLKCGPMMLKAGINPYVLALPTTDEHGNPQKNDPDSFFTSREKYDSFSAENKKHYIVWLAIHLYESYKSPDPSDINMIIAEVCETLMLLKEFEREAFIEELVKVCGTTAAWKKALNDRANAETKKNAQSKKLNEAGLTDPQQQMIDTYGFYEEGNCYYVVKNGTYNVSNFILEPLFLIEGITSSKRLFRMKNNRGVVIDMEINTDDMVSKTSFCKVVERRGNFLFTGTDTDLAKIKSYLLDNTKCCQELTQLGWNPDGRFWAWSNGLYTTTGRFLPIDEYGCVEYNGQWYYMPACSTTTSKDKGFYRYERRFVHQPDKVDIFTWASKFIATFGDNAIVGICYFITCMYRDLAMAKYRSFPLLDIFGQRGSGKTKFVMSLLRLFGKDCEEGPNIGSDTVPAIADQLSKAYNGFVHLDEYKNNIEPVKIEMLKGAYENRGRGKMDMDRDKKRKQLPVDSGVILSGQEMTTADNALFSRVIYMTFNKTRFSPEQVDIFEDLKKYEEKSLTSITNQLIKLRTHVEQVYDECTEQVKMEMRQLVDTRRVEERIIKNYSIMLAIMKAVDGKVNLPFTYASLLPIFTKYIERQNSTVSATSEVADFWGGIETLLTNGNIDVNYDLIIKTTDDLTVSVGSGSDRKKMQYSQTMQVLYLNTSRVFSEYMMLLKRTKTNLQNQCDILALKSYLTTQDEYLGESKCYFLKPMKISQDPDAGKTWTGEGAGTTAMKKQSRCLCFNYAKLREEYGIDLKLVVGDKYNIEEQDQPDIF